MTRGKAGRKMILQPLFYQQPLGQGSTLRLGCVQGTKQHYWFYCSAGPFCGLPTPSLLLLLTKQAQLSPFFAGWHLPAPVCLHGAVWLVLANELGAKVTGDTSGLEHLITSVRQVGFPGIGTEMNICAGGLWGSVLTTTTARRDARLTEHKVDDCSCSRGLSQPQERSEARAAFSRWA